MRKQILKIDYGVAWTVVHDDKEKLAPFIIYYKWYNNVWHSKKIAACADLATCLCVITKKTTGKELRLV